MYLDIASRYAGHGSNNGRIGYSVRAAANEFKIGLATAKRALDKLQERGFIACTTKGAFSRKAKTRDRMAPDRICQRCFQRARDQGIHALETG
jgi:DNA-binding transcriptional regulator YhcF (GntR family)